ILYTCLIATAHSLLSDTDDGLTCSDNCSLTASCLQCQWPNVCDIGDEVDLHCYRRSECALPKVSTKYRAKCLYCWQLPEYEYTCAINENCTGTSTTKWNAVECIVNPHTFCLGSRRFWKNMRCNISRGYSWSRTLFLSITLGGFGLDRFYLGLWKSAIGKLFSFGGLGVWTMVDVILVGLGYIKPHDDSIYC
ncbi:hypothetical protein PFISCL1PPCAC_19950, partial [Pristionchus fissidentatus]